MLLNFSMKKKFWCLPLSSVLNPLKGLPVFQIWRECRQIVGDTNLAKNLMSEFFLFQVRRLETLVPKNHFVCEVAPFPRSGHILLKKISGLKPCPCVTPPQIQNSKDYNLPALGLFIPTIRVQLYT